MPPRSDGSIIVTGVFRPEGDVFTAECLELGTATFGDTLTEAIDNLREAIAAVLNTMEDVGECERYLSDRGVKFAKDQPTKGMFLFNAPLEDGSTVFKPLLTKLRHHKHRELVPA